MNKPTLRGESDVQDHYISIWKQYPDELLDRAQSLIESDLGYNGTDMIGLCWVPIYEGTEKADKLHMPMLRDGLVHAIMLAVKNRQELAQAEAKAVERERERIIKNINKLRVAAIAPGIGNDWVYRKDVLEALQKEDK